MNRIFERLNNYDVISLLLVCDKSLVDFRIICLFGKQCCGRMKKESCKKEAICQRFEFAFACSKHLLGF